MKKLIKQYVSALALVSTLLFSPNSSALIITSGQLEVTASVFINTSGTSSVGIGQVDVLRNNGLTIWSSGDAGEYLNFTFDNYVRVGTTVVPPVTVFESVGGKVDFWLTKDANAFRPDLNFLGASSALQSGPASLYISGQGNGSTFGIITSQTYSANGFLDAVGGSEVAVFDTNSLRTLSSVLTDLSFNVSADNISTSGVNAYWTYSGSADLNGRVVAIDEPKPAKLMVIGLGLLGLSTVVRKRG